MNECCKKTLRTHKGIWAGWRLIVAFGATIGGFFVGQNGAMREAVRHGAAAYTTDGTLLWHDGHPVMVYGAEKIRITGRDAMVTGSDDGLRRASFENPPSGKTPGDGT